MALAFTQLAVGLASTTNGTGAYTATAGTPVAGDLLICFVLCSGNSTVGTLTGGGWTWTRLTTFTKTGGADIASIWYAYASSNTSTAPSYTPSSAASGCLIHCVRITGGEGKLQPYIRQFATNSGTGANPTVVFSTAPLTGNGILAWASNATNSTTQWTAPTGLTEIAELAFNTPANSLEIARAISGVTATTLTWTNAQVTAWVTYAIELYNAGTGPTSTTDINSGDGFFGLVNTI